MADKLFAQPSVLMRMENIGKVSENQMRLIGAVGMTARMANVDRDLRVSHPFSAYKKHSITSDLLDSGDVWARAMLRRKEIKTSIEYIRDLLLVLKSTELPAQPIKESELRLV